MAGVADKNALKAGSFILASLVLAIAVFWAVRGISFDGNARWAIRFDLAEDVGGLTPGSEVRIGGVKAGQVDAIELGDALDHVMIEVSLPEEIILRDGTLVKVQSTVTGVSLLNFESLGEGEPLNADVPLDGRGGNLTTAIAAVAELAPTLNALATDLREESLPRAHEVLGKVGSTVDTFNTTASKAGRAVDKVDALLADNRDEVDATIANLKAATDRVPQLLDDVSALVERMDETVVQVRMDIESTSQRLDSLLATAQEVADDAKTAADDTRITLREVRGIIQGNRGQIEEIIDRMTDASSTLSLAASEIRRSPWRLLYKPDGQQRQSLDLYDSARRFAEGANALQDAAIALEDATADPTADSQQIQALLERLRERFETYEKVESEFFRKLE